MRQWITAFVKSIAISYIFLMIGYAIMEKNRVAGVLFIAFYSTFMVVKAYRRPIPLGYFSSLLPGLMALFTYSLMSSILEVGDSDVAAGGFMLGIIPGIIMGVAHRVYSKDGRIWARKSFVYLIIWGCSYLLTQFAVFGGLRELAGGALAISGFSSASIIVLSVFLLFKFKREKLRVKLDAAMAAAITLSLVMILPLLSPTGWSHHKGYANNQGIIGALFVKSVGASGCPELSKRCNWLMNTGFVNLNTEAEKAENTACWKLNDQIKQCRKNQREQAIADKATKAGKPGSSTTGVYSRDPKTTSQLRQAPEERFEEHDSRTEIVARAKANSEEIPQETIDMLVGTSIMQLFVAAIMSALLSSAQAATPSPTPGAPDAPAGPPGKPPLYDPNTGEKLPEKEGKYWVWGKWVDEDEATSWIQDQQSAQNDRRAEIDKRFDEERKARRARTVAAHQARGDHYDTATDTWQTKDYVVARKAEAATALQKVFDAAMLEKNREHVVNRMRSMLANEGKDAQVIDDLIAAGDWERLNDMFRDRVYDVMQNSYWEHRVQRRWATAAQVGKYTAQFVEGAAKASIAALAGPATLVAGGGSLAAAGAAAAGTGLISGAGEAATAHASITDLDGNVKKEYQGKYNKIVRQAFGAGFLSGAKDGAVGVYCGGPGVSRAVKVFVPAGLDVAETYIRTGDGKKALISGGLSVVGDVAGDGVDLINNKYLKEAAGTALSGAMGGVGSYAHGGKWGDGVADGLFNRVSSRTGGGLTQTYLEGRHDMAVHQNGPDEQELRVKRALANAEAEQSRTVEYDEMGDRLRSLHDSMHRVDGVDPKTGEKISWQEVDPKKACDQLVDPGSSRTAKRINPELQEAMVNTRNKRLIEPADQATIARVKDKPEIQRLMKPGDQLVIKGFSTPGAPVSVGADRDAIMVIARPDSKTGKLKAIHQVDRRLWQNEAYEEFYNHTSQYANRDAQGNITAETEPEFMRQKQELDHLKKRPLDEDTIKRFQRQAEERVDKAIKLENQKQQTSDQPQVDSATRQARIDADVKRRINSMQNQLLSEDQIEARAWAASRNQVFTDPYHVEASRDNSNQILVLETGSDGTKRVVRAQIESDTEASIIPIVDQVGNLRTAEGIREAQDGHRLGLIDDEAYTRMWIEKSSDYADSNLPEAVAQTQKAIKQMVRLRDGQRLAGAPVPPLKAHIAEAMELLVQAPVDHTASPEQMSQLDQAIRSIRRPDPSGLNPDGIPAYPGGVREAMEKLPEQNRLLRAAMSSPQVTVSSGREGDLAADAARGAMRNAAGPYMGSENGGGPPPISDPDEDQA